MSLLLEALKKAALEKQGKTDAENTAPAQSTVSTNNTSDDTAAATGTTNPKPASSTSLRPTGVPSSVHVESHLAMPNHELRDAARDKETKTETIESPERNEAQIEETQGELEHSWDPTLEFDIEVDESLFTGDAVTIADGHHPTSSEQDSPEDEVSNQDLLADAPTLEMPTSPESFIEQPLVEETSLEEHLLEAPSIAAPLTTSLASPLSLIQDDDAQPDLDKADESAWLDPSKLNQDPDKPADAGKNTGADASPEDAKEEAERIAFLKDKLQAKIKAENRAALEHLVKSGQALERSKKHRARFLYAMLIMTAFGGIVSYYFYLLANSNISELQSTPSGIVDIRETDVSLGLTRAVNETGQISGLSQPTSQEGTAQSEFNQLPSGNGAVVNSSRSNPSAKAVASIPNKIEISGSSSSAISGSLRDTSLAGNSITQTAKANLKVASPKDQNALSNFSTLKGLDSHNEIKDQPTRVIVHHRPVPAAVSNHVQDGYQALQNKDYVAATAAYQKAVAQAPNNRDALLGAAAAATAQNRTPEALRYYQQQLNLDPQDSYARAGILSLANSANSLSVARELDALISTNPSSAHLHFLKGTNLAASKQWPAAQQAFFEAYFRDKGNPDYAFNLAISLDHLNQREQAIRFYNLALENNTNGTANFDTVTANKRLNQLEQSEANDG